MDTLMLSRVQLGSLTAFHLLFPAVTLTLGWVLVAFRLRGGARLAAAFGMWMPIYALTVAFQVVSGWALLTQFQLTMPLFSAQAGAVAGPLQVFYVFGNVLQVLPLSLAAWGIRSFNGATVTALIALSALGSLFSLLSPMILMSWMVDPVGTYTTQWTLGSADWLMLLLRSDVWFVIGFMTLASGATVGFLMACLSTFRWTAGTRTPAVDGMVKTGLLLAAISSFGALFLIGLNEGQGTLLVTLTVLSLTSSGLLVVLRRPDTGLAQVPDSVRGILVALPLLAWAAALQGWPFGRMLHSAWLIHGQMRIDDAVAVLPPGSVDATLPVYLATIAALVMTYGIVLRAIACKGAKAASLPAFAGLSNHS